jgi:hypothetical protein
LSPLRNNTDEIEVTESESAPIAAIAGRRDWN